MSQPNLLELEAPIKICGAYRAAAALAPTLVALRVRASALRQWRSSTGVGTPKCAFCGLALSQAHAAQHLRRASTRLIALAATAQR